MCLTVGATSLVTHCVHLKVSQHSSLWTLLGDQLPHKHAIAEDVSSVITPTYVHMYTKLSMP